MIIAVFFFSSSSVIISIRDLRDSPALERTPTLDASPGDAA
jgi:hypothetical protein